MPTVFQLLPDATMLRELEPEELAGALVEHLNSLPANEKTSVHPGNLFDTFCRSCFQRPSAHMWTRTATETRSAPPQSKQLE